MDLGRELIKGQLFFRRELSERVYWLITIRWFIAGAGLLLTLGAARLGFGLPVSSLAAVFLFVFLYNLFFLWLGRRFRDPADQDVRRVQAFAHAQVSLDLAGLFLVIILTGGMASPLLIFLTFHVVLISLLLPPLSCLVYTLLIIAVLTVLTVLGAGLPGFLSPAWALSRRWTIYLPLAAGLMVLAYLTTSLKLTLRFKGREMLRVSRELELSTTKLASIYEMVKEIGGLNNFQDLLDSAARNAARIMGVKACSIKLLDQEQNSLRFASTYGLSQDYLAAERIDLSKSSVNRRIIEGLALRHRPDRGAGPFSVPGEHPQGGHRLHALPAPQVREPDPGGLLRLQRPPRAFQRERRVPLRHDERPDRPGHGEGSAGDGPDLVPEQERPPAPLAPGRGAKHAQSLYGRLSGPAQPGAASDRETLRATAGPADRRGQRPPPGGRRPGILRWTKPFTRSTRPGSWPR